VEEAVAAECTRIADAFIASVKCKWTDADHCSCLKATIVNVFGEEYEEKLKAINTHTKE
jgi:hypothetical protein